MRRIAAATLAVMLATTPTLAQQRISFVDLVTDMGRMDGQSVEVDALGMYFVDSLLLVQNATQVSVQIAATIDDLPREQRRRIVERCGTFCRVTVRGTVAPTNFGPGLKASSVVVK